MTDEPTAWEDINPPMASAQRRERHSPSSDHDPRITFRNELTACLSLVAPAGMTEEARRDWLAVAWDTLKHLPPEILQSGCRIARKTCDHPSKIVPAIVEATRDQLRLHREHSSDLLAIAGPQLRKNVMDRRGEPMSEEDTAELNGILEKLGAVARYRTDGSRYSIEAAA